MKAIDIELIDDIKGMIKMLEREIEATSFGREEVAIELIGCVAAANKMLSRAEERVIEVQEANFIVIDEENFVDYYGEEVEFSDNKDFRKKITRELRGYIPDYAYPAITGTGAIFKYARRKAKEKE